MPSPQTTRCAWGVPLRWAQGFPDWEKSVRRWVRECRASGLTKFDVRVERDTVELQAMRPDAVWEPVA
jgi:hypothetical protein